jgi:hypothetical protein
MAATAPTAAQIAQDFEDYAPGTTEVTVQEADADAGTVGTSSTGVTALKRVTRYGTGQAGDGEVGATECKFWLRADQVDFAVVARCRVVDAEGITWVVGDADLVGFGALYICSGCTKLRS